MRPIGRRARARVCMAPSCAYVRCGLRLGALCVNRSDIKNRSARKLAPSLHGGFCRGPCRFVPQCKRSQHDGFKGLGTVRRTDVRALWSSSYPEENSLQIICDM